MTFNYKQLTLRNSGYVPAKLQKDISKCTVLVAGCGVGSTIAEAATRLGFQNFILVDGDTVERHNLNRQAFSTADIGLSKVEALGRRILQINPEASVVEVNDWVTKANVSTLVEQADLVFDTIDFLDMEAITYLHDECGKQKKPVLSAVSAGWGAALLYFPATDQPKASFRQLFDLPPTGSVAHCSYIQHFSKFFQQVADRLDPQVVAAMKGALKTMSDGKPCPAPHVSAGSYAVAALVVTAAVKILCGEALCAAPEMSVLDLGRVLRQSTVSLSTESEASVFAA